MADCPRSTPSILLSHRPESRSGDSEASYTDDMNYIALSTVAQAEAAGSGHVADSCEGDLAELVFPSPSDCEDILLEASNRREAGSTQSDLDDSESVTSSRMKKRVSFNEIKLVDIFEIPSRQKQQRQASLDSPAYDQARDEDEFPQVRGVCLNGQASPRIKSRKYHKHTAKAGVPQSNTSRRSNSEHPRLQPQQHSRAEKPRVGSLSADSARLSNQSWIMEHTYPSILQRGKQSVHLRMSHGSPAFLALATSRTHPASRHDSSGLKVKGDSLIPSHKSTLKLLSSHKTISTINDAKKTKSASSFDMSSKEEAAKADSVIMNKSRAWQMANGIRVHTPSISPLFDSSIFLAS